ncbi:hypothetical protein [Streptomyces sp. MJM1172]|uniref:hypothetical protein n=1 Tax=Streptomyces sp. MJM1172 TaxID=1703926 RepID=UPI000938DC72|nr:hypothetical protein [Streptomyces sp. MJM1172]OKI71393.1 hypothetical protein AMK15_01835 [Streptomyces sp. MJM1172]
MDWEWFRGDDWFVIKIRRVVKGPDKVFVGFSLTMVDRPHGGEETETREMFPDLDAVFEITGPLAKELRAEGWDKTSPPDVAPTPKPVLRLVQRRTEQAERPYERQRHG